MGLFDSLFGAGKKTSEMDEGVKKWKAAPGSVLVDVRERDEYAAGHVPGSVNLPLSELEKAPQEIPDKDTVLFVHCRSGARSAQAVEELRQMGYTHAENIGGVMSYSGKLVR